MLCRAEFEYCYGQISLAALVDYLAMLILWLLGGKQQIGMKASFKILIKLAPAGLNWNIGNILTNISVPRRLIYPGFFITNINFLTFSSE